MPSEARRPSGERVIPAYDPGRAGNCSVRPARSTQASDRVGALGGELTIGRDRSDPGVVDEHIEPGVIPKNRLGEPPDLGRGGKVRGIEPGAAFAGLGDLVQHLLPAGRIAAVDDDVGAPGREPDGHFTAEAAGCAGNEDDRLSGLGPGVRLSAGAGPERDGGQHEAGG